MDSNFNIQQNNGQQPMNQQPINQQSMYQQPMYQQPMYQQPMAQPVYMKPRRKGWIAGVIVAAVMVVLVIGYAIWYLTGFGGDLEGTWNGDDATTIVFEEIDSNLTEATYLYYIYNELGELEEKGRCFKNEKTDELQFMMEIWNDYNGVFEYTVVRTAEIKRLTDDKLIFKAGKEKYTYERD